MSIGSIFFGAALLLPALLYVVGPLFERQNTKAPVNKRAKTTPSTDQPDPALIAIRDLDFDFQVGKVAEADYKALRAQLAAEAAQALEAAKKEQEDALEAKIRQRREKMSAAAFCPHCGKKVHSNDLFCSSCGKALKASQ